VVAQGSTVTLTVAKAATKVPVPDLSDMTLAQAQDALATVGLNLGSKTEEPSDTVAEGHVISQDPIVGSKVKKGSLVDVVISSGPKEFTLPDVTCLSFGQAKSKLSALQLNVVNGGTAPVDPLCPEPNKVAAQDPSAGTKVHANDTVTLYTNELTSPSPSP
jgi:beta-lactam-binding protein with PASTA domain